MKQFLLVLCGLAIGAFLTGCTSDPFGQKDQVSLIEYEKCLEALNLTSGNEPYSPYLKDFEEKLGYGKARYELSLKLCAQYRP